MDKFILHQNSIRDNWSMSDFHSHNYYEIYLLTNGTRDLLVNNQLYTIKETTAIFIPPFVSHKTEGGPFERTNYYFSMDFLNKKEHELFNILFQHGPVIINRSHDSTIIKIFNLIERFYNENEPCAPFIIHSLITTILLLLTEKVSNKSSFVQEKQLPQDMVKALSYINANYKKEISASTIAETLFFSTDYFCKKFKKYFNCTFSDYVLNLRITKAKQHLQITKATIEHIAEDVGFSSANYFSLIFKKKVGQSPQSYRKNNQILDHTISNSRVKEDSNDVE